MGIREFVLKAPLSLECILIHIHTKELCASEPAFAPALGKQSTTTAASPSNRFKDYEGRILGIPELLSTPLNKSLNSMQMVEPSKETYLLVSM